MDGDFRGATAGRTERTARMGAAETGAATWSGRAPCAAPPAVGGAGHSLPAHDVRALTRGGTQAVLMLDGTAYSLRITRAGKLILTK